MYPIQESLDPSICHSYLSSGFFRNHKALLQRSCLIAILILVCAFVLPAQTKPQRIVSTAPSITETLFALGVGDRVVGVSRFCNYPPQVQKLPKVGSYIHPDAEAINSDHRLLMPCAFLLGGAFLALCDALGRIIMLPSELSTGTVLALIGGPYLVWVIRQRTPVEGI